MKKKRILSLLLCLSLFCTLIVPASSAYADQPGDSGMQVSKTATPNSDGTYTITLEAYATGSQVTSTITEDIPTDIILVLDQSGSMDDPMGGYVYNAYTEGRFSPRKYHNDEYYPLRHNGGSENLWHKLNNNEYIAVSVEQKMVYTAISGWSNRKYYDNQNSLYCLVSGEYKSVTVKREGHLFSADEYWYTVDGQQILYTTGDDSIPNFGQYAPLYQSVKKYIYSYTLNGATTVIEESFGDGSSPDTQFYRRDYSSSAGDTRLNALKNAATTFANAVAAKAAGEDGDINAPADNVNHRIAVVGFASGQRYNGINYNYNNTEVFVGSNQYRYGTAAQGQYGNAFQNMNTSTGVGNVSASIMALAADGGTLTNLGLEMANGIFAANPIQSGETRNRVVVLFTDGVPGWSGFESNTASAAISQASTAKNTYGATVYSIGIFSGADASSAGNQNGNETQKANWFMQQVSSNNGTPRWPSYYLSAGDADSLNSIFQQISNNITTGGSSTTLGSETVIKDIISPYFTLPAGASASDIRLDTYACTGKTSDTYTWSSTSGGNGGATATLSDDQVSVTGFNFSENWCGTETDANGNVTYRGNKLVISFTVQPKEGFLGGNEVPTNSNAGVYEDSSATEPKFVFPVPTVDVPIQDVTVTAEDKNVYLLGGVTAKQLKTGAVVEVGGIELALNEPNYGLQDWQTAFVDITVTLKKADDTQISTTGLNNLTDDTTYTIEVTVAPKNEGNATEKTGSKEGKINVFKPELTFKDSEAYYGETVPADFSGNKLSETWKHGTTLDTTVTMIGTMPTLNLTYTPEAGKIDNNKINTKQDIGVDVAVKIGGTDVTTYTDFKHQPCENQTCILPDGMEFLIHVKTCTLTINKTGGANNESYVFDVYKDGTKYSEVTIWGNNTETLVELPVGTYTIQENTGWSWRYTPAYGDGATLNATNPTGSITCTNTANGKNYWLNGFSQVVRNIFVVSH